VGPNFALCDEPPEPLFHRQPSVRANEESCFDCWV
jgi:hypothetical protein